VKIAVVPSSQFANQLRIWKLDAELDEAERLLDARVEYTEKARARLRNLQEQRWNMEARKWVNNSSQS
jgi:hypothetical protein